MPAAPRGFSLIEMFIVVAILGIVAAIALPSITAMSETRAASTEVDKVKIALDGARDNARARLRCMHVTKISASSLQIDEMSAALTGCGTTVAFTTIKAFRASSVDIVTNIDLTFGRDGALTGGITTAFVDIIVSGKHGLASEPHTFRVFRLLGLVRQVS